MRRRRRSSSRSISMAGKAAKAFFFFIVIVVMVGGGAALLTNTVWGKMHQPYKGYEGTEQFVDIPQGAGAAEIRRRLIESGVVSDEVTLRAALWWSRRSRSLKAGEYRFDQPMTPLAVVEKMANGDVYTRRLTFPEGLTIREMAALYEEHGFGSSKEFVAAASNAALINDLDPKARDLEGYLFPETYALPRKTPASRVVDLMVERFRATYDGMLKDHSLPEGLMVRQVVAHASLVEQAGGKPEAPPL